MDSSFCIILICQHMHTQNATRIHPLGWYIYICTKLCCYVADTCWEISIKKQNVNLSVAWEERSGDHQNQQRSFPGDHECLYHTLMAIPPAVIGIFQSGPEYVASMPKQEFSNALKAVLARWQSHCACLFAFPEVRYLCGIPRQQALPCFCIKRLSLSITLNSVHFSLLYWHEC